MIINLPNPKIVAGQAIEGNIILNFKTNCPPAKLTLTVVGHEIGRFRE